MVKVKSELNMRFMSIDEIWIARAEAERHFRYGEQHKQGDRQRQVGQACL